HHPPHAPTTLFPLSLHDALPISTLSIRNIGFKHQRVLVPADQTTVQVSLEQDVFNLEAVVVTGQATGVEQRNLANAVTVVNADQDRKSTRLNSSHGSISYAVFCL